LRRNGGGGIDPHPAPPIQPDLDPGVGLGLADEIPVAQRRPLAPLIAHHHSCRDTIDAHGQDESAGIVFAEAAPGLEQKLVRRVVPQGRRQQAVVVVTGSNVGQGTLDQHLATPAGGLPLCHQDAHARRDVVRELEPGRVLVQIQGTRVELGGGARPVACDLGHPLPGTELEIAVQRSPFGAASGRSRA
jgi:hypothetical protein